MWLNVGMDYDGDGRVNPFGKPDDALGSSARYLVQRGKYRRGEHWGYEVRAPGQSSGETSRSYEAWAKAGVTRADGEAFPKPQHTAKLWVPVEGGPAFLLGPNFNAIKSYNPSTSYTLAIVHLGDRVLGGGTFVQKFPGSERALTLAEVQEVQRRLTAAGFDTGGSDGRIGNATMAAVVNFQRKVGIAPADGYAGLKVLAKLRGELAETLILRSPPPFPPRGKIKGGGVSKDGRTHGASRHPSRRRLRRLLRMRFREPPRSP